MSAEDNKVIVRRYVEEVINRRNLDAMDETITPDYVDHSGSPGLPPGREGTRLHMAMFLAAFPDLQVAVEDQLVDGDKVATRYTARGTHQGDLFGIPPTGNRVTYTIIDIVRVADGKLAERWAVGDQMDLMHQLGVVAQQEQGEG